MSDRLKQWVRAGVSSLISWGFLASFAIPGQAQSLSPAATCVAVTLQFNTVQQGDVIVLGRSPNHRYVVVVPARNPTTLGLVRRCIADAFLSNSRRGPYVQAGAFPNRSNAEQLSWLLRSQGLDARVVYFR